MPNLTKHHEGDFQEGDVYIFNDPYGASGMHLPDFYIVKPVFVAGGMANNGPMPTTNAMSYLAVRCAIGVPIPNCEGYMRAITVKAPLGTVVNPVEPPPCGARGITCFRMFDALPGAFGTIPASQQ